ncbi:MAG TPA: hypothetical protein VGL56_11025 [Fimbriimonadaceae bacterium]|jgi:hypothetical protein
MSKPSNYGPSFDADDAIGNFLDMAAKVCFYGGLAATVVSVGLLLFYYFTPHSDPGAVLNNVALFGKVLVAGTLAGAVGSTYLFWGEELMHGIQLIIAAILFFTPIIIPAINGGGTANSAGEASLGAIQKGGTIFGVIAILALIVELVMGVRARMSQGARSDQLKYGKGIQEEKYQNKFMGKCWQLPYCRKFVREKCPIYFSKKTCWKEQVGCMCEEEVIRNAMENRPIPKDAIAAARYIPVNNKLNSAQKRARCKQCVIYNEHLRHQYRLMLPVTIVSFALIYLVLRSPLLDLSGAAITKINDALQGVAMTKSQIIQQNGVMIFREVILDCFVFVLLAYVLKVLEFVIFKLKV